MKPFVVGDRVIYSMPKVSPNPGPHAHAVHPSIRGEFYDYVVDKFWTVTGTPSAGQIQITTRRGKTRTLRTDDPRLRRASWLQRLLYRRRFPAV
ncbi:MAG: hypothetical protein K8T26_15230 [Lentisphaerae bacterium]|nr:hypothetical protein [Lentisphaerota bacterium]